MFFLATIFLVGCSETRFIVGDIPQPPQTAKLRIYVQNFAYPPRTGMVKQTHIFQVFSRRMVNRILNAKGIYEVVNDGDIKSVLGGREPRRWDLERNDWTLAREIAKMLYADYVLISDFHAAGSINDARSLENILINTTTDKCFVVFTVSPLGTQNTVAYVVKASYFKLFRDAKGDLLKTAIRKSRLLIPESEPTVKKPQEESLTSTENEKTEQDRLEQEKALALKQEAERHLGQEKVLAMEEKAKQERLEQERILALKQGAERERLEKEKVIAMEEKAKQDRLEQEKILALKQEAERERLERVNILEAMKEKAKQERLEQVGNTKSNTLATTQEHPSTFEANFKETPDPNIHIEDLNSSPPEDEKGFRGNKLVVYDMDTTENLKPTALILSECLREELFKLGKFTLVNRDDLMQILDEMKFQQSALVDDRQAVQIGKGMAANQVVTGRFGAIGKSHLMQVKRIDIESFGIKAIGSLKCDEDHEDTLLEQMPDLARRLSEAP